MPLIGVVIAAVVCAVLVAIGIIIGRRQRRPVLPVVERIWVVPMTAHDRQVAEQMRGNFRMAQELKTKAPWVK